MNIFEKLKSPNPLSWRQVRLEQRLLPKKPKRSVIIYIIKHPEQAVYKIGRSIMVRKRFEQLKKEYGSIEIIHLIHSVSRDVEKELHRIFKIQKVKVGRSREWFALSDNDISWLRTLRYIGPRRMTREFDDTTRFLLGKD
jgi:hypothetical protein